MERLILTELSSNEMIKIRGGINLQQLKMAAYCLGYITGYAYGEVVSFLGGVGAGIGNEPK